MLRKALRLLSQYGPAPAPIEPNKEAIPEACIFCGTKMTRGERRCSKCGKEADGMFWGQPAGEEVLENRRVFTSRKRAQRTPDFSGQRNLGVGQSLYDRILGVVEALESGLWGGAGQKGDIHKFEDIAGDLDRRIDNMHDAITETFEWARDNAPADEKADDYKMQLIGAGERLVVDYLKPLDDIVSGLNDISLENILDEAAEVVKVLREIANEIKQVGIDTHGGTTSPIDLGEWLY